jgi:hypothetical protein
MSILVSVRILISLFDLIHFLIFFKIAGAPQIAVGGNPCTFDLKNNCWKIVGDRLVLVRQLKMK